MFFERSDCATSCRTAQLFRRSCGLTASFQDHRAKAEQAGKRDIHQSSAAFRNRAAAAAVAAVIATATPPAIATKPAAPTVSTLAAISALATSAATLVAIGILVAALAARTKAEGQERHRRRCDYAMR